MKERIFIVLGVLAISSMFVVGLFYLGVYVADWADIGHKTPAFGYIVLGVFSLILMAVAAFPWVLLGIATKNYIIYNDFTLDP